MTATIGAAAFDMSAFEVAKHVTLPLLKIEPEKPIFVKFEGTIHRAKPQAGSRSDAAESKTDVDAPDAAPEGGKGRGKKAPPELAHVIDMSTGEHAQIIIGTVLGSELRSEYPADAYVGKIFKIVQHKIQGRDYATYDILELKPKAAPAPTGGEQQSGDAHKENGKPGKPAK